VLISEGGTLGEWKSPLDSNPDPWPLVRRVFHEQSREAERACRKSIQTNEMGRTALLLLGLVVCARHSEGLSLLDAGTAAGLTLLLEQCRVRFHKPDGSALADYGTADSPVCINCRVPGVSAGLFGLRRPSGFLDVPPLLGRLGFDRRPVDLADPQEVLWQVAQVWPGDARRRARLIRAVDQWRSSGASLPPRGDATTKDLLDLAQKIPRGDIVVSHLCLSTSGSASLRKEHAFKNRLSELAQERRTFEISVELVDKQFRFEVLDWAAPKTPRILLSGRCHPHGTYVQVESTTMDAAS